MDLRTHSGRASHDHLGRGQVQGRQVLVRNSLPIPSRKRTIRFITPVRQPGFPRAFFHAFPLQIVQAPGEVLMLFEWDSLRHQIFTDGRAHDTTLGPLWMGDSIGHWEGDTLVADTVNFNDKTWLDRVGHPHSDALHVVEHIRRVDHDHLEDEITIDDPKAYTKPWTGRIVFALKPKWTLAEEFCEDIQSSETIEKPETTPAK